MLTQNWDIKRLPSVLGHENQGFLEKSHKIEVNFIVLHKY